MENVLDGCWENLDFEPTTSPRLPEEFLGKFLSFLGRDFFSVRVTESYPKSRYHQTQSWETRTFRLRY